MFVKTIASLFHPPTRPNDRRPTRKARGRTGVFETLESRRVLAAYTWSAAADTLSIELGTNESLTVLEADGLVQFGLSTGVFSPDGGDVATGSGTGAISINASDLVSQIAISNLLIAGAGTNNVTFSGSSSLTSSAIAVNVTNGSASGSISVATDTVLQSTGVGGVALISNRSVSVAAGANVLTANGDIRLSGNAVGAATGNFNGVIVNGALSSTGSGSIIVTGHGANASNADRQRGVFVFGGQIHSSGTGSIQIVGVGGNGGTNNNVGVSFESGAQVTSVAGDIVIDGIGGNGTAESNVGVVMVTAATINATGSANVRITGVGGQGTSQNLGIVLTGAGVGISTVDGNIELDGTALDTTGSNNHGVWIFGSATVAATGAGSIYMEGAAAQTSAFGISIDSSIAVAGTVATFVADRINLTGNASVNTAGGSAAIKTKTTNGSIGILLGGADSGTQLGITNTELNRIAASAIVIGDSATPNAISISANMQHNGDAGIAVQTARSIEFLPGSSWTTIHGDLHFAANQQLIATAGNFTGVRVAGTIRSNGSGNISVAGRGGNAESDNAGVAIEGGLVTSESGGIALIGVGGAGPGDRNHGVALLNGAVVSSTGSAAQAAIIIDGAGGGIIGSSFNVGVRLAAISGDVTVTSMHADIQVIGAAGWGSSAAIQMVQIGAQARIYSTGNADVSLVGDSMWLDGGRIEVGENTVTLRPRSIGHDIDLGGNNTATTLGLTNTELQRIIARNLVVGGSQVNTIFVSSNIFRVYITDMTLQSSAGVVFSGGLINTAGGLLRLNAPGPQGVVQNEIAGVQVLAPAVLLDSDLSISIDGATIDSDYSRFRVDGLLSLPFANLQLAGSYAPQPGDVFTIVSATNLVGQFNGLANGAIVVLNGVELVVNYSDSEVTLSVPRTSNDVIVLGAEAGASPRVKLLDARTGATISSFLTYAAGFRGGVRVAVGDLNGDGSPEIIVAPGPGHASVVKVFTLDGNELVDYRTTAYASFSGGVFVAIGDVNGDGHADLVTSPGSGRAAEIKVFRNRTQHISPEKPYAFTQNPTHTFLAFGSTFTGGATVAAGDLNGDTFAEIVVGNGPGMAPRVRVFDLVASPPPAPSIGLKLMPFVLEIRPFNTTDRGGVFVAVGDVRGLGPEIVVGNGLGGRGRVEMFDATGARFKGITAFGGTGAPRNAPVHVAAKSIDGDSIDEVLTAQGSPGSIRELRIFKSDGASVDEIFEGDDDFRFGFFVA